MYLAEQFVRILLFCLIWLFCNYMLDWNLRLCFACNQKGMASYLFWNWHSVLWLTMYFFGVAINLLSVLFSFFLHTCTVAFPGPGVMFSCWHTIPVSFSESCVRLNRVLNLKCSLFFFFFFLEFLQSFSNCWTKNLFLINYFFYILINVLILLT